MFMVKFMRRIVLISIPLFLTILSTFAQPSIQWQFSLGGTLADALDKGNTISGNFRQTPDGGYILAGHSYSNDGDVTGHNGLPSTSDMWVVKLDSLGGIDWERSLGGSGDEVGRGVISTSDGGYIAIGESWSDDGDVNGHIGSADTCDVWVVKLDANGNIQWERSYGGTHYDFGTQIDEVNGGYVFIGDTRSSDVDVSVNKGFYDFWVVRIDYSGNITWENTYGGSSTERPRMMNITDDGGLVCTGYTTSGDGDVSNNQNPGFLPEIWALKIDSLGNIDWERCFGGSSVDQGYDIIQTMDGGYALTAWTVSTDGDMTCNTIAGFSSAWVAKLDTGGNMQWSRCYGGSDQDRGRSLNQTTDGGYLIGGTTASTDGDVSSSNGEEDCWIVKTDSLGNIEWEKAYGGSGFDGLTSAILTSDGGIAFAGQSLSNDVDVSGHHGSLTEDDIWVVKLAPVFTDVKEVANNVGSMTVAPNPTNGQFTLNYDLVRTGRVNIELYDVQGKLIHEIFDGFRMPGAHQHLIDLSTLRITEGLYNIRILTDGQSVFRKILLIN